MDNNFILKVSSRSEFVVLEWFQISSTSTMGGSSKNHARSMWRSGGIIPVLFCVWKFNLLLLLFLFNSLLVCYSFFLFSLFFLNDILCHVPWSILINLLVKFYTAVSQFFLLYNCTNWTIYCTLKSVGKHW